MYSKTVLYFSLIVFGISLFGCQNSSSGDSPETTQKPNIIFIMADDLGYADIGSFGQKFIQTPYLDQMAKDGLRFTNHYAGTAVCAPSRCALMTGYDIGHAEVRGNKQHGNGRQGQHPISDSTRTVAEYLKSAGYQTAMIGKWGLGDPGTSGDPNNQGFDYYFGYTDQVLAHNYFPEYLIRNGEKVYLKNEVKYLDTTHWHKGLGSYSTKKEEYSGDLFIEDALAYIDQHHQNPFFLYLPFTIPHDNGEAPKGARMEVPNPGMYAEKDWGKDEKDYAAMITRMDAGIGQILQKLTDLGLDENTLVIFTSDNGPMPGETFTEFFDSNGPLRGGKRDLYEGGIRVPFIARWKGQIQPGTESDLASAFWDFLPTACQIAGVEEYEPGNGISFLPTLLGKESQEKHDYLYWEFHERTGSQALRRGNWKVVRNDAKINPENPLELYDLSVDLGEKNDLASEYPELVAEFAELMERARVHSEVFPFGRE